MAAYTQPCTTKTPIDMPAQVGEIAQAPILDKELIKAINDF